MSKLKIIFFGTPSFAVDSLHEIQLNYNIGFVVTTPDKKSGRGQKINESEVKQYAKKNNKLIHALFAENENWELKTIDSENTINHNNQSEKIAAIA